MGAKKLQVVGEEVGRQDYSMRSIEVIPELFQTRAKIDPEVVREFCETIRTGYRLAFPPVLLARTPDGRLILADGFHRHESHHKCRQAAISGIVREVANADEALLLGIEANLNPKTHRRPEEDDRKHAIEMMIRNEEFRTWGDKEIARRCSISPKVVSKTRFLLFDREGLPFPERVKSFDKLGRPTGRTSPYRTSQTTGIPSLFKRPERQRGKGKESTRWEVKLDGKTRDLGADETTAREYHAAWMAERVEAQASLKHSSSFIERLNRRGIRASCLDDGGVLGQVVTVAGTWLVLLDENDHTGILRAIGRVWFLLARSDPLPIIVVGHADSSSGKGAQLIGNARLAPNPPEFLTPEEVVERFAPPEGAPGGEGDR